MLFVRKHSSTSNRFRIKLRSSSTGQGLTGLTSASSGLVISLTADNEATAVTYTVAASNIETIAAIGTFAAPTAGKCRFKEVDATAHPGLYEVQFLDSRFSVASAELLNLSISGASGLSEYAATVQLSDAVRGLGSPTALPNAAANATGGLYTIAGTGVSVATGGITSGSFAASAINAAAIATDAITAAKVAADAVTEIQAGLATSSAQTTIAGYLDTEIAAIKAKTDNLPAAPAAVGDIPTASAIVTAVFAGTADGDSLTTHLTNLRAMAQGTVSVTDNGNGTYTMAFKKADGTTSAFSKTYNPTTGARS